MRILIVEDHPDIAGNVGDYLEARGHNVDFASDGKMGLKFALEETFDVILLDINLPKIDGFELCRTLRQDHALETPVLMLTARDSLADKVTGYQTGAWDYLVKPFELQELELRIQALCLRNSPNQSRVLELGGVHLELDAWRAKRDGKSLHLHRTSLRILEFLMRAWPNAVKRQDLEYFLWGDNLPNSDPLRTHIHELRNALDKPFAFPMLRTLRGIGFVLKVEEENHDD